MKAINYKREDIIRKVGDKLNLTNDEMKLILETTLDTMAEILTGNHSRIRLELRNFGIFEEIAGFPKEFWYFLRLTAWLVAAGWWPGWQGLCIRF